MTGLLAIHAEMAHADLFGLVSMEEILEHLFGKTIFGEHVKHSRCVNDRMLSVLDRGNKIV